MAALPLPPPLLHRCRDGGGGATAADFLKNHRGSSAATAGFFKIHRGSGASAAAFFFSRTLKKCMNLIEF
jgi:hypothetical protein